MSVNTFGRLLRFTTWGESHGPALGAVVHGCPPGLEISEGVIQPFLDVQEEQHLVGAGVDGGEKHGGALRSGG